MKKYFLIFYVVILTACVSSTPSSLTDQRAQTDTILAFQGIKISEPIDSVLYSKLIKSFPVKLYDSDRKEYIMTEMNINGRYRVEPSQEIVHSLCLKGKLNDALNNSSFLGFVSLYEEHYGPFSYYQRLNRDGEIMGSFPVGDNGELTCEPGKLNDALTDFIEYKDSKQYKYNFVWEWNNQSIILSYYLDDSLSNASVTYLDTGYAVRKAEIEKMKEQKEEEDMKVDKALENQQI